MINDWTSRPQLRARDIDREYAMGLLRAASAEGQLTAEEFDQRLRAAMHATTLGELAHLVGDLQATPTPRPVVPVIPAVPYPYLYAPARPPHPRLRTRSIAAIGAGLCVLLLLAGLVVGGQPDMPPAASVSGPEYVPAPDSCSGVSPEDVDLALCVDADNPLLDEGLSGRAADGQKDLDLPGNLPVPARAEFVQPGWVSATYDEDGRQLITRRWHLEYLLTGEREEPVTPEHVAEVYRSVVAPVTYGPLSAETPLAAGGVKLAWDGGPYVLTAAIAPDQRPGTLRVRLDVLVDDQTAIMRPDVAGEFRDDLRDQRIATVPGMAYESSKVTWTGPTTCRLEQVWSATAEQFDQIGKQAADLSAMIDAEPNGGARLTFHSVLSNCTTFQL